MRGVYTRVQHGNRYASPPRDGMRLGQPDHARGPLSMIVIILITLWPGDPLDSLRRAPDEIRLGIYHTGIRRQLCGALRRRGSIQDAHAIDGAASKLIEWDRIKIIVGGESRYI